MYNRNLNETAGNRVFTMYRNVKRIRTHYGLSVKVLADIMGVSEMTLLLAEACADTEYLDLGHITRLCDYFGIEIDEMLSEDFLK